MFRCIAALVVLVASLLHASHVRAEKRALVVGVNAYDNLSKERQLEKAVNDARALGNVLKGVGFDVEIAEDVDRRGFNKVWSQFLERIEPRDVVAFQFSGHGIEIDGANYLVLRDAPKPEKGAKNLMMSESIGVDRLLRELQERHPQVSLLILDACRDNPFEAEGKRSGGGARGLARVDPPEGAFVMLSAGARQSALDRLPGGDTDPNSIYMRKLLPLLAKPGLSLVDVAQEVRAGVRDLAKSAEHDQTPAYYDQLTDKFYLTGDKPAAAKSAGEMASLTGQAAIPEGKPKPFGDAVAALKKEPETAQPPVRESPTAPGSVVLKPFYDQAFKALSRGDLEGYTALIDQSAEFIDEKGVRQSAAELHVVNQNLISRIRNMKNDITLYDVQSGPDRIIVKRQQETHVEALSDVAVWIPVVQNEFCEDVWEKKRGVWKLVKSRTLTSTTNTGAPSSGGRKR